MSDLTERVIEIGIDGTRIKVVRMVGIAREVNGYSVPIVHDGRKYGFEPRTRILVEDVHRPEEGRTINFHGDSKARAGDYLTIGFIADEKIRLQIGDAIYVEVDDMFDGHHHQRADRLNGYKPTKEDLDKFELLGH